MTKALLCGEVKIKNVTRDGINLVSRFQRGDHVVENTVYQVAGYHVKYETEFAFITNYFYTWITICQDEAGARSALNALLYTVVCAIESEPNAKWSFPTLPRHTTTVELSVDHSTSLNPARSDETSSDQGCAIKETRGQGTDVQARK
jgi:hypothetical protein